MSAADEKRFQELFDGYHRPIYTYCRRRLDEQAARECAAETFLVAWRRIGAVPEGERALPWLYAVARRVLANRYRSRRRAGRLLSRLGGLAPDPPRTPESQAVDRAESQAVLDALARLRPKDQEVLRLAVWEELPHKDIGEILGCSAHAVDQRIRRAGDRLASELLGTGHKKQVRATPQPLTGDERR